MTSKFCYLDFHAAVGRFIFSIISQNDYFSESLPKIFGAVVVTTQPVVHEVEVGPIIRPDPISVKVHDIVCWIFSSPQKENVLEIDHPDQVLENLKCEGVSPRYAVHLCTESLTVKLSVCFYILQLSFCHCQLISSFTRFDLVPFSDVV